MDVTCKTNNEGRPLLKVQGVDGEGHSYAIANIILWDESEDAFIWAFQTALSHLLGAPVCGAVTVIISDGDPNEIQAIDASIKLGLFPNAKRKRCFWHLAYQELAKTFGVGTFDSLEMSVIRRWLNELAYTVEKKEQFQISSTALVHWIRDNYDVTIVQSAKKNQKVQESRSEALQRFVTKLVARAEFWAKFSRFHIQLLVSTAHVFMR